MQPKWHIAFCNVTFTEYAQVRYSDYYASPEVMLETQLAAKEIAEERFGVGRFINPFVDSPECAFSSFLGMTVVVSHEDELPYIDTTQPLITDVSDAHLLRIGDPAKDGLMGARLEAYRYYISQGYKVGFGGCSGAIVTDACEVSGSAFLTGLATNPDAAREVLDFMVRAQKAIREFGASLAGVEHADFSYIGDDYAGLLSPPMFREFVIPAYRQLYADSAARFMHSELLRAEHLRIAREELGITEFHGAGCDLLTLEEMHDIMGSRFWTQLTPQEMLELSPAEIDDRVQEFAQSGAAYVQLYPGRDTPPGNMEAAIEACRTHCPGGPHW